MVPRKRVKRPQSLAIGPFQAFAACLGLALVGCGDRAGAGRPPDIAGTPVVEVTTGIPKSFDATTEAGPFRFETSGRARRVDFVHTSGTTPEKLFPTANGSGVAIFDADGDGRLDLYFATGNPLPLEIGPKSASNRFYRGLGGGKFRDETARSGLGFRGYCHGIAVGDIDNDGDPRRLPRQLRRRRPLHQ